MDYSHIKRSLPNPRIFLLVVRPVELPVVLLERSNELAFHLAYFAYTDLIQHQPAHSLTDCYGPRASTVCDPGPASIDLSCINSSMAKPANPERERLHERRLL